MAAMWHFWLLVPCAAQRRLDGELVSTSTTTAPARFQTAEEVCYEQCLDQGFCCNDDYLRSKNQYISCAQACMMRHRGQKREDLEPLCAQRWCLLTRDYFEYSLCSICSDLTGSDPCQWAVAEDQACQVGAQLQLCRPHMAGQIVTLYDPQKKPGSPAVPLSLFFLVLGSLLQ